MEYPGKNIIRDLQYCRLIVKKQLEIMAFVDKEWFKSEEYIGVICANFVIFWTLVDPKRSYVITFVC